MTFGGGGGFGLVHHPHGREQQHLSQTRLSWSPNKKRGDSGLRMKAFLVCT